MAKLFHSMLPTPELFEGTPAQALGAVLEKWIADRRKSTEEMLRRLDAGEFTGGNYTAQFLAERRAECVRALEAPVEDLFSWTVIPQSDGFVIYPTDCPLPQETFVIKPDSYEDEA